MVPANPYRTALLATGLVALGLAGVIWLIGTATINNASYGPDGIIAAAGFFATANSLLGLGVLALLLWLVVSSIAWQPPRAPEEASDAASAVATPRKTGSPRTELDRIREALDAEEQT